MTSLTYGKILIISLGAYFWSKEFFAKFFLGGLIFGTAYTLKTPFLFKQL